jgi:hypothetical protein
MFEKFFLSFKEHQAKKKQQRTEMQAAMEAIQSDLKQLGEMMEATKQICQLTPEQRCQMIYDDKYPRVILDYWNVPKGLDSVEGIRYIATDVLNKGPIYRRWADMGIKIDHTALEKCIKECDAAPKSKSD